MTNLMLGNMSNIANSSLVDYANLEMNGDYLYLLSSMDEERRAKREAKRRAKQAQKLARSAELYDQYTSSEFRYAYYSDNGIELRRSR